MPEDVETLLRARAGDERALAEAAAWKARDPDRYTAAVDGLEEALEAALQERWGVARWSDGRPETEAERWARIQPEVIRWKAARRLP
jgi:hypothetical protein